MLNLILVKILIINILKTFTHKKYSINALFCVCRPDKMPALLYRESKSAGKSATRVKKVPQTP